MQSTCHAQCLCKHFKKFEFLAWTFKWIEWASSNANHNKRSHGGITMDDIKKIDIYELLGIEPDATEQEVSFETVGFQF